MKNRLTFLIWFRSNSSQVHIISKQMCLWHNHQLHQGHAAALVTKSDNCIRAADDTLGVEEYIWMTCWNNVPSWYCANHAVYITCPTKSIFQLECILNSSLSSVIFLVQNTLIRRTLLIDAHMGAEIILGLRLANERRRYFVTTSLIGWAQT